MNQRATVISTNKQAQEQVHTCTHIPTCAYEYEYAYFTGTKLKSHYKENSLIQLLLIIPKVINLKQFV